MSEKDTISIQLVREALLQSCAPGAATEEVLHKVGIDPQLLLSPDARVPATAYARLWRLLARRGDDEFLAWTRVSSNPAASNFYAAAPWSSPIWPPASLRA